VVANNPRGLGIRIFSDGEIAIAKRDGWWVLTVGHYLKIWSNGEIYIGEYYLNANQHKKDRFTYYRVDGTINHIGGYNDAIVQAIRE